MKSADKPGLRAFGVEGPAIVLSPFSKERDQGMCLVPLENIVPVIKAHFPSASDGYRDGVLLVSIPPDNFIGKVVTLKEGAHLSGEFVRRKSNEEPRKQIRVSDPSMTADPIVGVDVVLYHRDVLAEGNENSDPEADYEIIAFLPKISAEKQPMPPETLMANHLGASGGTATGMSAVEFEKSLRESFHFWKDKAILP